MPPTLTPEEIPTSLPSPSTLSSSKKWLAQVSLLFGLLLLSRWSRQAPPPLVAFKWVHNNPDNSSLTSSGSYAAGTLRRVPAPGTTATGAFPVGSASQYAGIDLLSSQLTGTSYLDARFGPKADSAAGLSGTETSPSALRSIAVYPAGFWTLTPDAQPTSGSYAVQAYLVPVGSLADNQFGLLKRPASSTSAAGWSAGGGTLHPSNGAGRFRALGLSAWQ